MINLRFHEGGLNQGCSDPPLLRILGAESGLLLLEEPIIVTMSRMLLVGDLREEDACARARVADSVIAAAQQSLLSENPAWRWFKE